MVVAVGRRDLADRGPRGRVTRLSGVECMYLALETPTTPMHFGALVVLDGAALVDADGQLRLAELRRRISGRLAAAPELRQVVHAAGPLAGGPLWVDAPAFRIEHHVGELPMGPGPAEDDALLRLVDRCMASRLDRAHPLWRVWFVTGLPDGRIGLVVIVHHALTDGRGAMRLAGTLLSDVPAAAVRSEIAAAPSWSDLVMDRLHGLVRHARRLASARTSRAIADVVWSLGVGWSVTRHQRRTSLNAPVGRRRRTAVLRLDQHAARDLARAHGVGVHDVVLDLVAGGVRALLASRGEAVARLAPRVAIAVALPAAQRNTQGGNQFGGYVVPLPLGEADPVVRLGRIAAERAEATATQSVRGVTTIRAWTARFAPTRALMGRQRYVQLIETFLPGPPRPIKLLGARVHEIIPIQPLGRNVGLTVVASTYAGTLDLTVRVDPDRFPDLEVLLAAMDREWRALTA